MYILGRTQMIDAATPAEAVRRLTECGFDGVELCLEDIKFQPLELSADEQAAALGAVEQAGLTWNSVSFHQDYVHDDTRMEQTVEAIEFAAAIDSRVLVVSGGKRTDSSEDWPQLVRRTARLCRNAEDADVRLALEFEPGFIVDSTASLRRLFDEVGSDALCANLDLGHAFLQDPDPVESVYALGDRIVHCHIEDMARGVHRHLMPGKGDMDIPALVEALRDTGFAGGLALDIYGVDYEAAARSALPVLRQWI